MEGLMTKEAVIVEYGTLRPDFPAYGQSMACYVCGDEHGALNVARIKDDKKTTAVPLCPACVLDKDAVIKKHMKAPDHEVYDVTEEQIVGVVESIDKTEH
jgi:protein-arginine kinase activator protein McsA